MLKSGIWKNSYLFYQSIAHEKRYLLIGFILKIYIQHFKSKNRHYLLMLSLRFFDAERYLLTTENFMLDFRMQPQTILWEVKSEVTGMQEMT